MPSPLVSLVIPCRNGAKTLASALQSCRDQDYANLEILFVDNDSDDGSPELAGELAERLSLDLRILSCPEHGANKARNLGLDRVRGDYVCMLDVDDQLMRGKLHSQVDALDRAPEFGLAYGNWRWRYHAASPIPQVEELRRGFVSAAYGENRWVRIDGDPSQAERHFRLAQYPNYLDRLLANYWSPPHSYMLRGEIAASLQEIRAFWPERAISMDREYYSIAALLGYRFLHVPKSEVVYNAWSEGQMTRQVSAETRRRELDAIHQRLRELAAQEQRELTPDQQMLLDQPRDIFTLSREKVSVTTNPSGGVLYTERGVCIVMNREELACLRGLARVGRDNTLENLAARIAFNELSVWERHLEIMRFLLRLVDAGILVKK